VLPRAAREAPLVASTCLFSTLRGSFLYSLEFHLLGGLLVHNVVLPLAVSTFLFD
jgi:hypothetical protein